MSRNLRYACTIASVSLIYLAATVACADTATGARGPLQTRYSLGGDWLCLGDQAVAAAAASGSASRHASVWEGSPVYGDLDADGDEDAAVAIFLFRDGKSLSYLAAAVRGENGSVGSNALLLGEQIGRPQVTISNGLIYVRFEAPSVDAPDASTSRYRILLATLKGGLLTQLGPVDL
jgi:phage baseplate assembly protein gpV